jgi:putative phosphoesterase
MIGAKSRMRSREHESRVRRLIGLIADTHGLLRPQAVAALDGCDSIIHAGDVGNGGVLDGLRAIAPVVAVRGNVDTGALAETLPATALVRLGGCLIHVLHDLQELDLKALDLNPHAARLAAVIAGHSHRPRIERRDGVLYVNPGSAGPRRFKLPVTVGRLALSADGLAAEIIDIGETSRG